MHGSNDAENSRLPNSPNPQPWQKPRRLRAHLSPGVSSCTCGLNQFMRMRTLRRHGHLSPVKAQQALPGLSSAHPYAPAHTPALISISLWQKGWLPPLRSQPQQQNPTLTEPALTCPLQAAGPNYAVPTERWNLGCHSGKERYRSP